MFQSYDWCAAWLRACKAVGLHEDVRIVTLWRNNRAVLIWPLAVRRLFSFRILHSFAEPATQCADVLVEPGEDAVRLVEHALTAVRTWKDIHLVELRRVRDGSPLKSLQTLSAFVVTGTENAAPVLDFTRLQNATVDAQRSSRSRNALHRHERKIGALGVLCYELLTEPERECEALLRAAALKRVWTREKGLMSSGNAHPASLGCLLEFAHRGKLTVAQLLVGDRVAAIEIGIVERGCYWSLCRATISILQSMGLADSCSIICWSSVQGWESRGLISLLRPPAIRLSGRTSRSRFAIFLCRHRSPARLQGSIWLMRSPACVRSRRVCRAL